MAERSLSYHRFPSLSSTFFDFFQNLFRARSLVGLSLESLVSLSRLPAFVKPFFRFSWKTFFLLSKPTAPSATARLIYHVPSPLSSPFFKKFEIFPKFPFSHHGPLIQEHISHTFSQETGFTMWIFSIYFY